MSVESKESKEKPETKNTLPTQPSIQPSVYQKPDFVIQPPTQAQPQLPTRGIQQVAPQPTKRELTEEEKEFLDALGSLVTSAQELSYVLASVDPEILRKYSDLQELIECARNVVRAVYRFHKLIKRRTRGSS